MAEVSRSANGPVRETLLDFFADLERHEGQYLFLHDGVRTWSRSYRELVAASREFAATLERAGIKQDDKVLLWAENRPEWIAALWGCLLRGVVAVPVDYRSSLELVSRLAVIVDAKALVTGEETWTAEVPGTLGRPVWKLTELTWPQSSTGSQVAITKDKLAEILFTSGATADPKGVLITHRNVLANIVPIEREIQKYLHYSIPFRPLRFLELLPLSHLFGQSMAAFIPPMVSGEVHFTSSLHPKAIVDLIRRRRISVMVSVPKMLETLRDYIVAQFPESAQAPKRMHWTKRWWKFRKIHSLFGFKFWAFVAGAAPLDPKLEEFWSRLGFLVIQGYGLTETAPIVTLNHPFHARKGSVGKRIAGVEIKIAEDGEVLVRGENVTQGYFGGEGSGTRTFEDGWLHTGDIGTLDPDGTLHILGRKKEMIVAPSGLKIFPEDVERVINQVPGVKESAVVGKDRVHAVLVLEPGATPEHVVRDANQRLEEHQKIRDVTVWTQGPLPRTEGTAKLKRAAIFESISTGRPAQSDANADPLVALLRKHAPGREINKSTTLEDLGLSSLDRVELMMEMEQRLGRRIDETCFQSNARVADLASVPESAPPPEEPIPYPFWTDRMAASIARPLIRETLANPLLRWYVRLEVRGAEHLTNLDGPVLFAPNHQSHLDVPVIQLAVPRKWRYKIAPAMSQEFFDAHFHPERHPASSVFTNRLNYVLGTGVFRAFPLSQRGAHTREALAFMGWLVDRGISLLLFPEGRMTDDGSISRFQSGVGLIASKLRLPVVPVRLQGLDKVLHKTAKWASHGRARVTFGPPLRPLAEETYEDFATRLREAVLALE
jgi:long-chain acyl-CoA synthetase